MANYIDGKHFHSLFVDRLKNHNEICICLNKIVEGIGNRQKFISPEESEDIKSTVLVHTLGKISCFDDTKSNNAFSYFSQIIFNQFRCEFTKNAQKKRLHYNYLFQQVSLDELFKMKDIEIPIKKAKKVSS